MKKKNKIILFVVCLAIFLIAAPATIFYSQGYRFDFQEKKIKQTGGLFLKAKPKKVKIYINDRFKKETDFFFGSALIENLLPEKYKITLQKDGFQKWEKMLKIEEKKVTEAKDIILWPEKLSLEMLSSDIEKMFLFPDKSKAIFLEIEETQPSSFPATSTPPETIKKENLKLYDLERKVKSHLIGQDDFRQKHIEILDIVWASDSQNILIETAAGEQIKYWLLEIFPQPRLILLDFLPQDIFGPEFYPQNPKKIIFQKLEKSQKKAEFVNFLFEADLKEKKVNPSPLLENFLSFTIFENNFYWLEPNGFLFKMSIGSEKKEKINQEPLSLQKGEIEHKIFFNKKGLFLQEGGELYWFSDITKTFQKIFEETSKFRFSPDNESLALIKEYEIWVYFFEEKPNQPQRKKGEKIFLTRFANKIEEVFWLNSHYLLFNVADKILAIEIDNRDKPQIWNLAELSGNSQSSVRTTENFAENERQPAIFFNENSKKLYIFSQGKLYSTEILF